MSNKGTSHDGSGRLPDSFVDHAERLKPLLGPDYDQVEARAFASAEFARLIAKRPPTLALSFDEDDENPVAGVDDTARALTVGRPGATPGAPRTRLSLRTIAARVYGHTPPFAQVQSEAAPAPEGADDTATDPEWDARVAMP